MQQVSRVERFAAFCIERRKFVTTLILALTVVFAWFAAHVEIKTIFHDLLPKGHPFIEINDKYNERFGGPNIVSIMVEAENGDIFQPQVLERIKQVTDDLYLVPAINQFQVISLASRKIRSINSSTEGIETKPMMWPDLPPDQAAGLASLPPTVSTSDAMRFIKANSSKWVSEKFGRPFEWQKGYGAFSVSRKPGASWARSGCSSSLTSSKPRRASTWTPSPSSSR